MEESESIPQVSTSVLIVSHNCEPALRRCLAAIEASEQRETFEVLTVDCGSMDGGEEIDGDFPAVTVRRLPRHFGRTKARNIGARSAKGEFLFFLEPDVEVMPDTIPRLVEALREEPKAAAACPLLVDPDDRPVSLAGSLPTPDQLYQAWAREAPWAEATLEPITGGAETAVVECPDPLAVMVRTATVRAMNYLDERYGEFGSDIDLFTQARRAAKPILLPAGARARCRRGEDIWQPEDASSRTALSADYAHGIIAYTDKYYRWTAAIRIRLRIWLKALAGLHLGLLNQVLSGNKIDGSQTAF